LPSPIRTVVLGGYHLAQEYKNAKLRAITANCKLSLKSRRFSDTLQRFISYSRRIEKAKILIIKVNGLQES